MHFEQAFAFMIRKLETELPSYLTYHNVEHTLNVMKVVEHLALAENISGDDLVLLKTATLFHDSGFVLNYYDHEVNSCKLAIKYLPDFDYDTAQVEIVCRIIMSTRLPQSPYDILSQVLCDADLYYLGGDQYTYYADRLFSEFKKFNSIKTNAEWKTKQIEFLTSHSYFTKTAVSERETQKQINLLQIKGLIPHKR